MPAGITSASRSVRHAPRAFSLALVAAAGAACDAPTATASNALRGRWVTDAEPLRPAGSWQVSLTFTRDGRFVDESRNYGLYAGQPSDELSAYSQTTGTYRVDGDRIAFAPQALVTWDRFYGPDARPTVHRPYPYGGVYDSTRFAVAGGVLTLSYLSYPADAPVPTTRQFRRAE